MHRDFFEKIENTKLDQDSYLSLMDLSYSEALFDLTDKNRLYLKQWLPWLNATLDVLDTTNFISSSIDKFNGSNAPELAIFHKNKLVGCIGLHEIQHDSDKTAIGYWLAEDAQGKGLITKACKVLIKYVFEELNLNDLHIRCAVDNLKSRAIPEKLGFNLIEIKKDSEWLYDHFVDHAVYSMTKQSYTIIK